MPQLDTNPWLSVLVLSWITFMLIVPAIVVIYTFPNNPVPQDMWHPMADPWAWPWF
uniref:ATP synthase F0 subunit 8 n=1 Tax=Dario dayingensis TaxID=1679026 RepID=UPI00226D069C|nr:ATP synthase F0 subunit 8 [Dario dayingensis]UZC53667.1 ATP synthase F0 subunit 8 [Dario dayingensis]WCI21288.1 ATP synthase F0 subunit 8 [Dario dayingensis]